VTAPTLARRRSRSAIALIALAFLAAATGHAAAEEEPPADGGTLPPAIDGAPRPADSAGVPPPEEPEPPPLPASLAGVPEPVLALHVSTTFCEDPSGPPLAAHAALVAELSPTATLVGIPCSGDADRAAFRLYVLETGEIGGVHAQFFALPSKSLGWAGTEVLWSPAMDAEGALTGTFYDPGEGRCRSRGRWAWTGYALAMRSAEVDDGCGGSGGWRTVFP
jgi:hypothetical protein